jgi:hypothetical protein
MFSIENMPSLTWRLQMIHTTELATKHGNWKVHIKGNGETQIVDQHGRQRHRSDSHQSTAIHLAMKLAERDMPEDASADQYLKEMAQEFLKGADECNPH